MYHHHHHYYYHQIIIIIIIIISKIIQIDARMKKKNRFSDLIFEEFFGSEKFNANIPCELAVRISETFTQRPKCPRVFLWLSKGITDEKAIFSFPLIHRY